MNELELRQEKQRLENDLNGGKTYWYKEEVQRDQRALDKVNKQLTELELERETC